MNDGTKTENDGDIKEQLRVTRGELDGERKAREAAESDAKNARASSQKANDEAEVARKEAIRLGAELMRTQKERDDARDERDAFASKLEAKTPGASKQTHVADDDAEDKLQGHDDSDPGAPAGADDGVADSTLLALANDPNRPWKNKPQTERMAHARKAAGIVKR